MSVSNISEIKREKGQLLELNVKFGIIQRFKTGGKIKVSISEFMQAEIVPSLGTTYRYSVHKNSNGALTVTNITLVLRLVNCAKSSVINRADVFTEDKYRPNAYVEWFNWEKGFGAVLMMEEEEIERTAFVHISVLLDALDEVGLREGVQLCSQEVYVVVVPDPQKDLRVTKIHFTEPGDWLEH